MPNVRNTLGFGWSVVRKRPFSVLIQVTNRCNLHCGFCDFWNNPARANEEVTVTEYERLSSDLKRLGTFVISLEGGEPLLRQDLVEIVRALSRHHLPVLYTNGWHVTSELSRALFDAGLHQVGVSIDFAESKWHDLQRGVSGVFEKAIAAAQALRAAAPRGRAQVHLMTVLMRDNQDEFEELLKLSEKLDVAHQVTLLSKTGYRRGKGEKTQLPSPGIAGNLRELRKRYRHFSVFEDYLDGMDRYLAGSDLPHCQAGTQSLNIDHVGNVSVCIEKIDRTHGNIKKQSILEIFPKLKTEPAIQSCQNCWTLCRGFGQSLSGGGSLRSWKDLLTRMNP